MENELTDAGGRMIADGLKGNCSVTRVDLVSAVLLLVRFLLLTCVGQGNNYDMSDAVKWEITQGLQERHGADKGVAVAGSSCRFFDFETCENTDLNDSEVRLLSLHDAACTMACNASRTCRPHPCLPPLTCS
jgi:hypothetical protein